MFTWFAIANHTLKADMITRDFRFVVARRSHLQKFLLFLTVGQFVFHAVSPSLSVRTAHHRNANSCFCNEYRPWRAHLQYCCGFTSAIQGIILSRVSCSAILSPANHDSVLRSTTYQTQFSSFSANVDNFFLWLNVFQPNQMRHNCARRLCFKYDPFFETSLDKDLPPFRSKLPQNSRTG